MPEDRAYWLHTLGDTYYRQGRYVEAEAVSQQALALERKMDDKRTLTECLNTLSEIALATGHVELAENHNREALGIERAGHDCDSRPVPRDRKSTRLNSSHSQISYA